MNLCEYGCNQKAVYKFDNGKLCCSNHYTKCPYVRKTKLPWNKNKTGLQIAWNKGKTGIYTQETINKIREKNKGREPWNKGKTGYLTKESLNKMTFKGKDNPWYGKAAPNRYTITRLKKHHPFFSKIEQMRYNPNNLEQKEIQVRCKNHLCKNSKEKDGWFTPTKSQIYERIRQLEKDFGNEGSYFYCSQRCKETCPLYYLNADPFKTIKNKYTEADYQTFRNFVLERDNYICQFCGEKATDVHHERPQKLEPLFALDPDYAWSFCENCHYEKGHKDECSTKNIANRIC